MNGLSLLVMVLPQIYVTHAHIQNRFCSCRHKSCYPLFYYTVLSACVFFSCELLTCCFDICLFPIFLFIIYSFPLSFSNIYEIHTARIGFVREDTKSCCPLFYYIVLSACVFRHSKKRTHVFRRILRRVTNWWGCKGLVQR